MVRIEEYISLLIGETSYPFSGGLCSGLPLAKPGVYTIWKGTQFLYVGTAGRGWKHDPNPKRMKGIKDRLDSHLHGRRSGSTLALSVWDRLVMPDLSADQRRQIANGDLDPNSATRDYIRKHLCYRFITVNSYPEALEIEKRFRIGETKVGAPLLNPHKNSRS
jgi:hypothetical protein